MAPRDAPGSVLDRLRRPDKWQLGGGRAAVHAPRFPLHDRFLGFWDPIHFADVPVRRLFTVLLVDEEDRPIRLRFLRRDWRPDRLRTEFEAEGLRVIEERAVLRDDLLVSRVSVRNARTRPRRLAAILWSLQEKGPAARDERAAFLEASFRGGEGRMRLELRPSVPREVARRAVLLVEFAASPRFESRFAGVSQRTANLPTFEVSPFDGALRDGRLSGEVLLHDWENDGEWRSGLPCDVHLGLARRLRVPSRGNAVLTVGARLTLVRAPGVRSPRRTEPIAKALARDPIAASERSWSAYLGEVPSFECDDPDLERFWWHRWFGLRLHAVEAVGGFLRRPCVFEGIDAFRAQIPYSVQAQVRECAWMRDPSLAEGNLLGILEAMNRRGEVPGHVRLLDTEFDRPAEKGYPFPYRTTYLADLGGCALLLFAVHGSLRFVREVYPLLERHASHWGRDRDREGSGLFDVLNQCETGQEYARRYLAVDREADRWGPFRLKGIDASVYAHGLHRTLAIFAVELGDLPGARKYSTIAAGISKAIRERMWDRRRGFFFDLDPRTGSRIRARSAVGFYPFLWGIAGREHLGAIRHLFDPRAFGTPWPVPTASVDDPSFDARARWKGKRTNCPWSGRVWPMATSHVADALDRAASLDARLAPRAGAFVRRFVRMMSGEEGPNSFEHYDPYTGAPSLYRGVDDVQHSWVNDLLVRVVAGLRPHPSGGLRLRPRPAGLRRFRLRGAPWRGRVVDVEWDGRALLARIDGRLAARRRGLGPLEVAPR
ncbi:MAG TPA: hypothetical protein VFI25_04550 [Planctomycetota bacterium]|jgi:hypothetical protein|nr:hypothetical protein [Planctomycetota bacterium]